MGRRMLTATAQPENMSFSQDAPGHCHQEKQPLLDQAGPVQTKTTAVGQAQSIPGLSHKLPDDRETLKETSQLQKASILNAAEQSPPNGNTQSPAAFTGKLMEKLRPSTPSKTVGNDMTDALLVVNEVPRVVNVPSGTNGRTALKVQEKTNTGTHNKTQQGDDSTARTEELAPRSSTKVMVVSEDGSNLEFLTKESKKITTPSAPLHKDPVQEPTPQPASRKGTSPTRVSTGTSIVPAKTRARGRLSGPLEFTPSSKHGRAQGDKTSARSSASRSEGRNGHRRVSSSVRERRTDRADHMTWEAYKASPLHNLAYPGAGREQRHRSASPVAPWLIDDEDREVERLTSRYPDLRDWLELTGWHVANYRERQLDRLRRMADIERTKVQLEEEFDREKARLKEYGEPASLKRRRIEESDDKDGGPPKYYRTNRDQRGSRSGSHGSRGTHHCGREEGGRSPPHRDFSESLAPRYLSQRDPREPYRPSSAAGHTMRGKDFDAERDTDRHMTRDRLPSHHLSPRFGSSPHRFRGYFHKPE